MKKTVKLSRKVVIFFNALLLCVLCVACVDNTVKTEKKCVSSYQWQDGEWKNFGEMLNKCDSITVVVAVGENKGNTRIARYHTTVVDYYGKCFTYAGAKLDLEKGDTVKWAGNAH